jgi:glycosyltransferase involved in cell wall biosynthesis
MFFVIFSAFISAVSEMLVHIFPIAYRWSRNVLAVFTIGIITIATCMLLLYAINPFSIVVTLLNIYRVFNLARVIKGRMHEKYLWHVTYRTSVLLLMMQLAVLALWVAWDVISITTYGVLAIIMALQFGTAGIFLRSTWGHARRMRMARSLEAVHDKYLPTLTVAIPARNETDVLHDCVASLIACHYPKLEILVLDDCSQTTRTPEIIKSFAHDGVRFLKGKEPAENWLAKNQAYATLAEAANGEYILFAGVDIRFDKKSLRQMVGYARAKNKNMISVMPHNILYHHGIPLLQPMRYVWELAIPRRALSKPPVLSSCWLITKQALKRAGGFDAAARMVVPEAYFAKSMLNDDGYSFLASGDTFGITSVKDVDEQRDTAIRVGYPQIHRRPEVAVLITLGYIAWVTAPATVFVYQLTSGMYDVLFAVALTIVAMSGAMYAIVLWLAYSKVRIHHLLSFPVAVLVYVALINYSMYKYEFSEVLWKGRNVCLPVMHVIPRLPQV